MTLVERLADAHQRSVTLYLQRQLIEQKRQQIMMEAMQCDQQLVKLDGEIEVLTALVAAESAHG